MSAALDLAEEFRSLDEIEDDANDGSGHKSIGGADLSGILALDDDGGGGDFDGDAARKPAPTTPSRAASSASFLRGGGGGGGGSIDSANRAPTGQQLELERETVDSDAWDSHSDGDGQGANSLLGRTLDNHGVATGADDAGAGRGGGKQKQTDDAPPAARLASSPEYGRAGGSSSAGSNRIVSSPTRPAEEGSDWDGDGYEGRSSSDDAESESDPRQPLSSGYSLPRWSKTANAAAAGQGVESCRTTSGDHLAGAKLSPPTPLSTGKGASSPGSEPGAGRSHAPSTLSSEDEKTALVGSGGTLTLAPAVEHNSYQRPPSPSRAREPREESRSAADKPTNASEDDDTTRQVACRNDDHNHDHDHDHDHDNDTANHTVRHSRNEEPGKTHKSFQDTTTRLAEPEPEEEEEEEEEEGRTGETAAVVEALRAELGTLREHVVRSDRKREAQLRELVARLEAQERRRDSSSPTLRGTAGPAADGVVVRARTGRPCRDKGGGMRTPQGAAVRNPFAAGTGGGAAMTPRDHFPAFEDALLDDGDGDEDEDGRAALRGRGRDRGEVGGGGYEAGSKSALLHQSEAFDFSIDTLSHINNHTDFGTDAPVAAAAAAGAATAPPAVTAATSPKIGSRDARGAGSRGGQRENARLPLVIGAPVTGGRLKEGEAQDEDEGEEVFDAKDAAAEEAFFSDACATASLQTPVKHLLATAAAAASDLGVAVRSRGGSKTCVKTSTPTPARRRPLAPSSNGNGEQQERQPAAEATAGRPPHGRESVQSCGDRGWAAAPDSPQTPQLCMADFFARASAELEGGVKDGGGQGVGEGGISTVKTASAPATSPRSVGVDAACQTTLSFSVHDEVRLVSIPASDGRRCRGEGAADDGGVEWSSLGWYRSERRLEKGSSSGAAAGAALGPAAGAPSDGRGGLCHTLRQSRAPLCQTPCWTPASKRRELPADEGEESAAATEAPSYFNSPNLSPIAVARPRPDGAADGATATAAAAPDEAAWRAGAPQAGGAPGRFGEGDLEDGAELEGVAERRKQRCRGFGHGLSPILSEGGYSASSRGGEERQAFDSQARARDDDLVRAGRASGLKMDAGDGDGDRDGDGCHGARREVVPAREDSLFRPGGATAAALKSTGAARSSGSGPLFIDSSMDVTRSSVLRASTTLNTIALLDDTGLSPYNSRAGVSFAAGELFADARLRVCSGAERASRYDVVVPLGEAQLRRGDNGVDGAAVPPSFLRRQEFSQQQQQQRRSRSAPALGSEWSSMHSSRSEVERLAAGMARETAPLEPAGGGVPPAVVGAWLAAAVEGIYSHNAFGGGRGGGGLGGGLTDQRAGTKRSQTGGYGFPVPAGPAAAGASLSNAGRPATPARARHVGAPPAFAAGPGDSPPPPPPPPPRETLMSGEDDEEAVNEEEIFYQRQRLLQRVVSAAASHGGVLPSLSSVRDASLEEKQGEDDQDDQEEQDPGSRGESNTGQSWRRHSDPLSRKTRSVAAVAAEAEAAAAAAATARETEMVEPSASAAVAAGWTVRGVPAGGAAYTRRHTSGYWRDRLGMTH